MYSHHRPQRNLPVRDSRRTRSYRIAAAALALTFLGACSSADDGASVRDLTEDEESSASGSASAPADEPVDCVPVSPELESEATQIITITNTDFKFSPSEVEVEAGLITFEVVNDGSVNHELAFLPGGGDVPLVDGAPDEDALGEAGAFELEAFGPGQTCNATYELEPGTYTMFCIVEAEDGETHYDKGMAGTLVVS